MDINALLSSVGNYTVLLIPLVLGLTEVLKRFLPDSVTTKFTPVISLTISVLAAILLIGVTRQGFAVGIVIGLSASGLWSGGKTLLKDSGQAGMTNRGFIRLWELFLLWAISLMLATIVGCGGSSIKPSSAVPAYETTGAVLVDIYDTGKALCDSGTIKPADCQKIKTIYNKARAAYITAGDALIVAINTEDAVSREQNWTTYTRALIEISALVPELIKTAQDLGVISGARVMGQGASQGGVK